MTLSVSLAVGAAGLVIAQPARAVNDTNPSTDQFRTGGCSGCFTTQMNAATSSFTKITRVFRGCETGPNFPDGLSGAGCAGAALQGKDGLLDFVVIQGDLKCSGTCDGDIPLSPDGLGVPHGQHNVTYRVSSTGSSRGLRCANGGNNPSVNSLGFLAPEGMDGIPGTTDDAGVGPGFGVQGVPAGWPNTAARKRDALVDCSGKTGIAGFLVGTNPPNITGVIEECVVQYDQSGNKNIDVKEDGVLPGVYASVDGGTGNETTNIRLTCDTGFADLPPADFENPAFNTQTFSNQSTVGAQIFKIIVNKAVYTTAHPGPGGTKKIALNMPQIEGLFGGTALATDACSWDAVGGAVNGDADNKIQVCFREDGSGTRETFRNTFMREPEGSHPMGTTVGTFACTARLEGGGALATNKSFQQNTTAGDESGCVVGTPGGVGYVNASRTDANFYAPPVFGVDPETNDLRNLVKCGQYPYWGPLTGGTGIHSAFLLTNVYVASHLANLRDTAVFSTGADYLPLGGLQDGVAFDKGLTSSYYNVKFTANNCTGEIVAPAAHP
ncbi:MAG TPA: substrate-binding domain-containing protein [Myxococcota bacterium]|nr:substrate-binding domain-containing protein [Myxococcota bacterium]